MLIKLNYVCGSYDLYIKFYSFLQPYIFPFSFSTSLTEQIRKMKYNIELYNKGRDNVKLFQGGIRDIEFSVQALQPLNGGKLKELRTGNTLKAIELLYKNNLLRKDEKEIFTKAYFLYRKIEHFLQLMNDTQTHIIPSEGELLFKLCKYLQYENENIFQAELDDLRKKVRSIYNSILSNDIKEEEFNLRKIKFKDINRAEKNFKYLSSGLGFFDQKEFDSKTINLFNQIEPDLIIYLENCCAPDIVLENFVKVIRATRFPSIWYSLLSDKNYLKSFLKLCEFCSKGIEILALDRSVEELFFSKEILIKNLQDFLNNYNTSQLFFILSVQFCLGLISTEKISKYLCNYIDFKINTLGKEYNLKYNYFIGALGSYGALSPNFSSDVDLIIVTDDIKKYPEIHNEFQNLHRLLKNELKYFNIDFRLRPEGKSSPLVWDIKNYENYLESRARVWEFQALSKLRFISGNKNLFEEFKSVLINKIKSFDSDYINKEMLHIYKSVLKENPSRFDSSFNIKKQNGGLITIDFILQSSFFKNAQMLGKRTIELMRSMRKYFLEEDYRQLYSNYSFLRKLEFAIQCVLGTSNVIFPSGEDKRLLIASFFNVTSDELYKKLISVIKSNISLFEKYVGKI